MEEAAFYHAIAVRAGGDYATIKRALRDCVNWRQAYEKTTASGTISDPETERKKLTERNITARSSRR